MPVVSVVFMLLAGRNSMGKVSLKVADVIVHVYFLEADWWPGYPGYY